MKLSISHLLIDSNLIMYVRMYVAAIDFYLSAFQFQLVEAKSADVVCANMCEGCVGMFLSHCSRVCCVQIERKALTRKPSCFLVVGKPVSV